MIRLIAFGVTHDFTDRDLIRIGRSPQAHIFLDSPLISREHAELRREGDDWVLVDLNSRNGIFHLGERCNTLRITEFATVTLGGRSTGVDLEIIIRPDQQTANSTEQSDLKRPTVDYDPRSPQDFDTAVPATFRKRYATHSGTSSGVVRIGRSPSNDIVIPDVMVSRYHAELVREPRGELVIIDLRSHNGTFVNGERVSWATLQDGDLISIGHHQFILTNGMLDQYVDTGKITFDVVNLTVEAENGTTLVDNVAFSLEESSLLAILGPSGSGKSSLVRALTGLTIPTSGDILYDGRSLYENFADLRDRIAYVSQQDSVHEHLTVEQALMYIAELRLPADIDPNEREQEVRSLIEELGLSGAANTRIDRISGGQRRRVTIASELLTRPSLLVLDEPTSGLDPGRERSVMQLLRSIADGGRTVIVVTHSIQELSLCDRVLFLAPGGEVAYFGPPDQVFEYFATDDYPGVFAQLDTPADRHQFGSQFAASPLYKEFVADPIRLRKRIGRAPHNRTQAGAVRGSPARQFGILVRRYLQLLSADRRSLLILLGQAPLLGLLILIVANANSLNPNLSLPRSGAVTVLLMIVISATLMGFLNAIREIVKERPIYLRERMVGLSIVAYVGSKFVVLAAIALLQVAILVPLALARQDGPNSSVVISPPGLEIFVAVSAAAIAAIGLALATSALVTRSDQAISLVSLLLVPQILLAGAIVPLEDSPVMRMISHAISAKWGFSAVASTVDLRTLNSFGTFTLPGMRFQLIQDTSWTPEVSYWVIDIAALGIIILVFLSLTIALMRRSDPAILQNAAHPGGILRDLNFIFHLRNIFRSCQGFAPKLLPGAFWAVINLLLRRFIL